MDAYHVCVTSKWSCEVSPKCGEIAGAGYHSSIISAVVVRVYDCVFAFLGDMIDDCCKIVQISTVQARSYGSLGHTLNQEGYAEDVEALANQCL